MYPILIHFDGGTPCNNPAKGYGVGYGSFSLNGGRPVRVNHGIRCSNNVAEILTLCRAVESILSSSDPSDLPPLRVTGDSQIALKWAQVACGSWPDMRKAAKQERHGSPDFQSAIARLRACLSSFSVTTQWLPRAHAVRAFGH